MNSVFDKKCLISPSLISCFDMCNLEKQVRVLEKLNVPLLHIDILDGHFSPSMPLGLETVKQLKKITDIPFDTHVMTTNNEYFVDELIDYGVEQIIIHLETEPHSDGLLNKIRNAGIRAGLALKPGTPVSSLECLIHKCDTILLMLINPGYASSVSETQVPYADKKIRQLRTMIEAEKPEVMIELDGRISLDNLKVYGAGVANIFVAGSTMIKKDDFENSIRNLINIQNEIVGVKK